MEDVIAVKRSNPANSPAAIKGIILQISKACFESRKISEKIEENEARICELSKEISALKDEFEIEEKNLRCKENESQEHDRLLKNLKENEQSLELTLTQLQNKHKTLKKTKPSLHDQQLLERGKRKLKLYKEFTGIRWDYAASESVIEGYITNKKEYLKLISYKSDIDYKTLKSLLWKDIEQSVMDSKSEEDSCKENRVMNR